MRQTDRGKKGEPQIQNCNTISKFYAETLPIAPGLFTLVNSSDILALCATFAACKPTQLKSDNAKTKGSLRFKKPKRVIGDTREGTAAVLLLIRLALSKRSELGSGRACVYEGRDPPSTFRLKRETH
jgi:hypothetical protein